MNSKKSYIIYSGKPKPLKSQQLSSMIVTQLNSIKWVRESSASRVKGRGEKMVPMG